jgi:hypothetical protein
MLRAHTRPCYLTGSYGMHELVTRHALLEIAERESDQRSILECGMLELVILDIVERETACLR